MPDRLVAVDDADYRLPEPVLAALANDTEVGQGVIVPDGAALGVLTHAALQTALDAAYSSGRSVVASGSYTSTQTLEIRSSCVLDGVSITYMGSGTAVRAGVTSGSVQRKDIRLPRVENGNKPSTGWGPVAGSIGVDLCNLYTSEVYVPYVRGFEVGLRAWGMNNEGSSYLNVHLGHLDNNKINQQLGADTATAGWANQLSFYGGRSSHNSAEGTPAVGTKHIHIKALTTTADPNTNTWYTPSLESPGVVEYAIDAEGGSFNLWINPRFEFTGGNAKVRWGARAVRNRIIGGNMTDNVEEIRVAGQASNSVEGTSKRRFRAQGATGGDVLESESSAAHPVWTVMRTGASAAGDSTSTQYVMQVASNILRAKQHTDTYDRVLINGNTGSCLLGNGTAAPVAGIQGLGAFLFFAAGVTTAGPITDGGANLGAASDYRFNYVRAKTATVTGVFTTAGRPTASAAGNGAIIIDSTLNKIIRSDGTSWYDAMGAAV